MQKKKIIGFIKCILVGVGTSVWVLPFWACMDVLLDVTADIYRMSVMEEGPDVMPFDIEMLARPFLA
jgi:hypothetical protein